MYKFSMGKVGTKTKQHIMKEYVNYTWTLVGSQSFGPHHSDVSYKEKPLSDTG
jgi:hypothetical protein